MQYLILLDFILQFKFSFVFLYLLNNKLIFKILNFNFKNFFLNINIKITSDKN